MYSLMLAGCLVRSDIKCLCSLILKFRNLPTNRRKCQRLGRWLSSSGLDIIFVIFIIRIEIIESLLKEFGRWSAGASESAVVVAVADADDDVDVE